MSEQGTKRRKHQEAGATSRYRRLRDTAAAALGWASACALVAIAVRIAGEPVVIQGSGTIMIEDRPLGHFERVSLCDVGTLMITQRDWETLTVETDDNLMRYVESRVRGGTLLLGLSDEIKGRMVQPSKGITYRLSVRHIAGLEIADAGRMQAPALDVGNLEIRVHDSSNVATGSLMADTLRAYIEDSGEVHLTGRVGRQEVTAQDSGRYLAGQLQSRTAAVAVSDSAETVLWAMETLDVTVTDAGRVRYHGDPKRTQHLSDSGTLARLGKP